MNINFNLPPRPNIIMAFNVKENAVFYEVVFGSPCGRPENGMFVYSSLISSEKNWFSSEKNCCYFKNLPTVGRPPPSYSRKNNNSSFQN